MRVILRSKVRGLALCVAILSCVTAMTVSTVPAQAQLIDRYCTAVRENTSKAFYNVWAGELSNLTSERISIDITAYDRCNHGGINGYLSIYTANLDANDYGYHMRLLYKVSYSTKWWQAPVALQSQSSVKGTDYYSVVMPGLSANIGLTNTSRITQVKIQVWVSDAGGNVIPTSLNNMGCDYISRNCWSNRGL